MENRSNNRIKAWAIIDNRGDKIALMSGELPVYWLRKVAQARADKFNNGEKPPYVRVERVTVHRVRR